jgi:hypothetical protein
MNAVARTGLSGLLVLSLGVPALAQESKSAALAKQLAAALDEAKLTSLAVKDPVQPDVFVAALYYPGSMLLVVSAKMTAAAAMSAKIAKKDFQEAYVDLQSASTPETKVFVQDNGADGLKMKSFDSVDRASKSTSFDGDWKKQKFGSEQEYQKAFDDADAQYAQMLTALLGSLKKTS